jgi:sRNA-binding protein
MAGAARMDLEGNQVGTLTASDDEDARRKIAKAARRVAAKTDRKAASQRNVPDNKARSRRQNLKPTPAGRPLAWVGWPQGHAQARRATLVAAQVIQPLCPPAHPGRPIRSTPRGCWQN